MTNAYETVFTNQQWSISPRISTNFVLFFTRRSLFKSQCVDCPKSKLDLSTMVRLQFVCHTKIRNSNQPKLLFCQSTFICFHYFHDFLVPGSNCSMMIDTAMKFLGKGQGKSESDSTPAETIQLAKHLSRFVTPSHQVRQHFGFSLFDFL